MFSLRERTNKTYTSDEYQGLSNKNRMISYMVDRSESIGGMKKGQFIAIQNRASYADDHKGMRDGYLKELTSFKINFKIKSYIIFDNDMDLIKKIEKNIQDRFAFLTSIVDKDTPMEVISHKRGSGVQYDRKFFE